MDPIWLIEANCTSTRSEELQAELRRQGHEFCVVKFFPETMRPGDIAGAEHIPIDARVVCFGGPALLSHIQQKRRWIPGCWCDFEKFSCHVYYTHFGKYLLNSPYTILPASETLRLSDHLFETFGHKDEVFIRPSAGRKIFPGSLVEAEQLPEVLSRKVDGRTLVVTTRPRCIEREWRLYVVHERVVTSSQYATLGELDVSTGCPEVVLDFATKILSETSWRPSPLFSMDICESGDNLYLLELNAFNCSSLYACNLGVLVQEVSAAARLS